MAVRTAERDLTRFGDELVRGLPAEMPFAPEELTSRDFAMDFALERIAAVLARRDERH